MLAISIPIVEAKVAPIKPHSNNGGNDITHHSQSWGSIQTDNKEADGAPHFEQKTGDEPQQVLSNHRSQVFRSP